MICSRLSLYSFTKYTDNEENIFFFISFSSKVYVFSFFAYIFSEAYQTLFDVENSLFRIYALCFLLTYTCTSATLNYFSRTNNKEKKINTKRLTIPLQYCDTSTFYTFYFNSIKSHNIPFINKYSILKSVFIYVTLRSRV